MKRVLKIGVLLLCFQMSFAQADNRKPLHGQVVNASIAPENGYVINITAQTRTNITTDGFFDLLAQPKDVLVFTSVTFEPKKLVLTAANCLEKSFRVSLNIANNELEEVVVSNRLKVNALSGSSQRFVDKKYFEDQKSSPKNSAMPSDGSIELGMDFVRIFKEIKKILKKESKIQAETLNDIAFSQYVKINFDPLFFERDLKLNKDEIDLFLWYASEDKQSREFLEPEDRFLLMDFLVSKNKDFKTIRTFEE
ncbi:hypothetical protein [Flavobacterium crassostreae]|uniref:CarboxypepD_reg-like domain-containing protein n=1 Tax=Flavobacterium crassostreae TaxID=1763534 RepID=A0A1B9DXQ2_9FLAO|nr:hypothetical protein [Flavobacterium crassostreae]OCB74460.1 hypothetical protein LPBF_10750 [Flavobacterium crassostreae]